MFRPWLLCATAQLFLAACGNDRAYDYDNVDAGSTPTGRGGLPCDVQAFLSDHCQTCHGAQPANGAPMSLVTHADLTAKNASGVVIAQRALVRITSSTAQMPPLPAPSITPDDITMFRAWVTSGSPAGDCVATPGPFDAPAVCTSGTFWTSGNEGSSRMHPGRACITCHTSVRTNSDGRPRLTIGGTVYPTGHEPNDCIGGPGVTSAPGATVEVTDANGIVTLLPVNASGNFLTTQPIPFPIHVAVLFAGKRRSMGPPPPTGDCNSCHTQTGANGAPGRIVLP